MMEEIPFAQQTITTAPKKREVAANNISTVKYSWYTWLPKSLWDQFRRIANAYFLLISVLMIIGTYMTYLFTTPLEPTSTVGTLIVVLMITSVKELLEDLERGKSDKFENNRIVQVVTFDKGEVQIALKESKYVCPGDIIKLEGTVPCPCDLLVIFTSLYGDGNKCYIETANIDGETNLKVREAPPGVSDLFPAEMESGVPSPDMFTGEMSFEQPNKNIHTFVGNLRLKGEDVPLGANNLVLRSALFSNTDWAYGVAIYTGQKTKIQMNNRNAPSKMSRIEESLNKAIIIIFLSQVVLVIISVISIYLLGFQSISDLPYVYPDGGSNSILPLWLEQFFVFFLLYNNFIPISLYVSIELVNVGQAFLVSSDGKMYRKELDVSCAVRASNLVQELGMVSNVFSDKTGTLTCNEMNLVKFVINGQMHDIAPEESPESLKTAPSAAEYMHRFGADKDRFFEFFRCLATCHTVVRERDGTYRAESPDELALVEGAGRYRCALMERGSKIMNVSIFGDKAQYEVLAVNPFNSDRKRMSLLLKDTTSQQHYLMCKGADNIMLPLCTVDEAEKKSINTSLLDMSNLGLRTLIIAHKEITQAEAAAWLSSYKAATMATKERDEAIAACGAKLELEMTLLGVTAIEDRLQDEVPEVIADLTRAGIIVWMLTGDKLETAINIGRSCNLILPQTHLHMIANLDNKVDFASALETEYNAIIANKNPNSALVLDGPSFTYFDDRDPRQRMMMLRIGAGSRSVIACRLTPTQKRELVKLVKVDTVPQATTLSIGDGANDVPMILEGNVGVGIFGKEGRQAANNADFAIGEFKFLRRLLLVHGRWNYVRQSKVFLYCMHKNMVLTLTLFWFSYYTAVSGTSLYQSFVYTSFNFVLGLPIIFFGILDRDLSEEFMLLNPQTYKTGRANVLLSTSALSVWILNAMMYATVICLVFNYALRDTFQDTGLYEMGTSAFVGLCMSLQAKVAFFHHQWAYPQICAMAISILGMIVYLLLVAVTFTDYWYVAQFVFASGIFWLVAMFFMPLTAIFIDWVGYFGKMLFRPTEEQLYREMELEHEFNSANMLTCLKPQPKAAHSSTIHGPQSEEEEEVSWC